MPKPAKAIIAPITQQPPHSPILFVAGISRMLNVIDMAVAIPIRKIKRLPTNAATPILRLQKRMELSGSEGIFVQRQPPDELLARLSCTPLRSLISLSASFQNFLRIFGPVSTLF